MKESKIIHYLKSFKHLDPDKGWFLGNREKLHKFIRKHSWSPNPLGSFFPFLKNFRFAPILAAISILSLLSGGIVVASQESLPGAAVFPVKLLAEEAEKFFARDDFSKTEVHLKLAERRLEEIIKITTSRDPEENQEEIRENIERFKARATDAENFLLKLNGENKRDEEKLRLVLKLGENFDKHQEVLEMIEETVPEQAQESIRSAREALISGEVVSLKILLEIEQGKSGSKEPEEGRLSQTGSEMRAQGKIGAATNKIQELERKISLGDEEKEEKENEAQEKLEEAKSLLTESRSDLESSDFLSAFQKAQEAIRITQETKDTLRKEVENLKKEIPQKKESEEEGKD